MAVTSTRAVQQRKPLGVRMADALVAHSWRDLSPAVIAKAKLCVLDLLSSALSSTSLPWSREAAAVARRNSGELSSGGE